MSSKAKQAQRTKNNTRPSSSGRSAELLGSAVPSFVGFPSIENCGFVPVIPGFQTADNLTEEFGVNIDSNFQIILRKMTKKDSTTKIKALHEFIEIVDVSEVELVKKILPFWPKLYTDLSMDVEHRVREAAQKAQSALVKKVGKHIAPYLRQLAPQWIISQYDTYAPAASIATLSFETVFPPKKLAEVFNFCENEILEFITKSLTVQTPQTLCNPKTYTLEESEAKYQRLVIASLQGYCLYLEKMDKMTEDAVEKNKELIDNTKFWSFHKNKTAGIRAAWFKVIEIILESDTLTKHFLEKNEAQVVTSVFNFLDESEPAVVTHVWAAILLVQKRFGEWHKHVNLEKAFQPRLWKTLKSGGHGCAAQIFPHLLPLISKLDDLLKDKADQFYMEFFDNMKIALKLPNIQNSRNGVTAVAKAYYECLQYKIIHSTDSKFCIQLIENHILDVIQWCIASKNSNKKYIFEQICRLINYWSQYDENAIYVELTKTIWKVLFTMMTEIDDTPSGDIEKITEAQVEFIISLKHNMSRKKERKVKFNMEVDEIDAAVSDNSMLELTYETELNNLVQNVCDKYIKTIEKIHNPVIVERLERLFKNFDSIELYKSLNVHKNLNGLTASMVKWLSHRKLRSELVMEIIFKIFKFMEISDRIDLITKLVKFNDENVQKWIITRVLSHPLCKEPYIPEIISLPDVTEYLVKTAKYVTEDKNTTENLNLLHKCFFQSASGDILIDKETSGKIVDIISIPLTNPKMIGVLDVCGSFLAQIMPVIFVDDGKKDLQTKMFLRLFHFSINQMISDDLSKDTLWEITTSWQDALSSKDLKIDDTIIVECTKIVDEKLKKIDSLQSLEVLENISEMIAKLIICSTDLTTPDDTKLQLVDKILSATLENSGRLQTENVERVENLCLFIEAVSGHLTCPAISDVNFNVNYESTILDLIKIAILKLNTIFNISCSLKVSRETTEECADTDEELTDDYYDPDEDLVKTWPESIYIKVEEILYENALVEILLENQNTDIEQHEMAIIYLQEKLSLLLCKISSDKVDKIRNNTFENSMQRGCLWSYTLRPFLSTEKYSDAETGPVLLFEDIYATTENFTNEKLNVLQSLSGKFKAKTIPTLTYFHDETMGLLHRIIANRCLLTNHFASDFNEFGDRKIVDSCLNILNHVIDESKGNINYLMYNKCLNNEPTDKIIFVTEIINFLTHTIKAFPREFDIKKMDFIRIAISSWILSVSQSVDNFTQPKIAIFTASVYRCFAAFAAFIEMERSKSSSQMMTNVIEEWEQIFAKDVNLVILKCYLTIVKNKDSNLGQTNKFQYFLDEIGQAVDLVDLKYVIRTEKIDSKTTLSDLITQCLDNLSHSCHSVRITSANIIKRLTPHLISKDLQLWYTYNEQTENQNKDEDTRKDWHILNMFAKVIERQHSSIQGYIHDFNFKLNEDDDEIVDIDRKLTIPYFLLWDCILNVCGKASSEMRSIYASWIAEHKYEHVVLSLLFRVMPADVLMYPDSKIVYGQTMFTPLQWTQIKNPKISAERYACHLYTKMLRYLPAIARKWWQDLTPRQGSLVDKITTNFVSGALCQDELRVVLDKRDKDDKNMHVKVHTSTREVVATYAIDETKLELIMSLPINHPLGSVKVESGKQIGGRLQSRVLVMQLTIFLSHQNGSIWDGLSLWKRNLDRKFEGVEECYVCYSIIHQDTCQLPKLSCKTCKKKFHGPCLYKWFSTSNKSTCPICRNIF